MKAFTPTVASSNTSSNVRGANQTPITPSIMGETNLHRGGGAVKTGALHMPKTAVNKVSQVGIAKPTHTYSNTTSMNVVHSPRGK